MIKREKSSRFYLIGLLFVLIALGGKIAIAQDIAEEISEVRLSIPQILKSELEWARVRYQAALVLEYRMLLRPGGYEGGDYGEKAWQNYREILGFNERPRLLALLESQGLPDPGQITERMADAYGSNRDTFDKFLEGAGLTRYGETFVADTRKAMIAYGFMNYLHFAGRIESFFEDSYIWPFCRFRPQ